MSEEEKKAYDILLMLKYFTEEKEDKQAIITILELVDKQQKEIKELKHIKPKYIVSFKEFKEVEDFKNTYISKDKIKEIIEDHYPDAAITILNELLEE